MTKKYLFFQPIIRPVLLLAPEPAFSGVAAVLVPGGHQASAAPQGFQSGPRAPVAARQLGRTGAPFTGP